MDGKAEGSFLRDDEAYIAVSLGDASGSGESHDHKAKKRIREIGLEAFIASSPGSMSHDSVENN
jgi:hypothetical protein